MILIDGVPLGGEAGGLPPGGTSTDVLKGDVTWGSAVDVLGAAMEAIVGGVAGQALVGTGDGHVTPTSSAVSALLAASDVAEMNAALGASSLPAIASVAAVNTGGARQFRINVEVRVNGVIVPCALVNIAVTYPTNGTSQFGQTAGITVENLSPYYGAGVRSYMQCFADLAGLAQVTFTGNTTGQTVTIEVWSDSPQSPHVTITKTVPA